ncbi:multi-sensor signal transduction multi-kinase [Candidatus Magnetomorum sp. HK-1]|nr:multi-sensor signal transduction multi-kinase [Candidatus Magnetomorum sp. HK-1]
MDNMLNKKYFIIDTIYKTQRTKIYKAVRVKDNLPVIIKALNIEYPSEKDVKQFSNGFKIVHDLNNDKLIQMYDLDLSYNQQSFAMEDTGGISLNHVISENPLSIDQFFEIAIKIINNLKHIHECQIIHQDINPSNIIWNSKTGQTKIIDFEMAITKPDKEQIFYESDHIYGSLSYISPEQTGRLNRSIDYRSDFYSLGISFYELLTQQKPFMSDTYLETIYCHISKNPENPTKLNSNIPEMLSEIILKMMAKMPEERYQSHIGIEKDLLKCQKALMTQGKITKFVIGQNDINIKCYISEKIYGRKKEIQLIKKIVNRSCSDRKQVIIISGDKGTGKTKIIQEAQKIMIESHIPFIEGNCEQISQNIPYSTWITIINRQISQWIKQDFSFIEHIKHLLMTSFENYAFIMTNIFPDLEMIIGHQEREGYLNDIVSDKLINDLFCKLITIVSQQNKLVIIIDDMQWIDSESLRLLLFLLQNKSLSNIFLFFTFRNDKTEKANHVEKKLKEIPDTKIERHHLPMENLLFGDILNLIKDTMITSHDTSKSLCELIYSKTRGNAFFVHQLLKTLFKEEIIYYDNWGHGFRFLKNEMEQYPVSNNVADLLITRFNKFPEQTQELLKIASCLGDKFNLKTMAVVTKQSEFIITELLKPALYEGLISSSGDTFLFSHQNIKQFIYELISKKDLLARHLNIGQQLHQQFWLKSNEINLFKILYHYNKGIQLITNESEKIILARLNHEAGILSINMNAYPSAIQYFTVVIDIFGDQLWNIDNNLMKSAYENRAKSYIVVAEFDKAELDVDLILKKTNHIVDRYQVTEIAIKLYTSSYQFMKGADFGIQYLRDLGIELPEQLDHKYGKQLMNHVNKYLEKSTDFFYQLPCMTDISMQSASIVLYHLDKMFLIIRPELRYIIPCLSIDLCLKFGQYTTLPAAFAAYASSLCHIDIKYYKTALYTASIAEKLCFKQSNKEFLPYVLKIRYGHFSCLDHSHTFYINKLNEGFNLARERGDNQMASFCYNYKLSFLFFSGIRLTEVIKTASEMLETVEFLGDKYSIKFFEYILFMVQSLNNDKYESKTANIHSKDTDLIFSHIYSLFEMITHFFYKNYQSACKLAKTIKEQVEKFNNPPIFTIILTFYGSLSFLSLAKNFGYIRTS